MSFPWSDWFEKSFAFYAGFHQNKVNQRIHLVCIWIILWTAFLLTAYSEYVIVPGFELPGGQKINLHLVAAVLYFTYYTFVELPGIAGSISAALIVLAYYSTDYVKNRDPEAWKLALAVHIICWIAQIYGHKVHEGNAPAFLDNFLQALTMAPLFVIMEVLLDFGYRPEFFARVMQRIKKN
jgi:uncharacterized membrane protein YGL010W